MTQKVQTLETHRGILRFTVAHRPRVTRRLHLELDESGGLVTVVPRDWPLFYLRRVLRKNQDQVQRFLNTARARQCAPLRYTQGGLHWYRGREHRLVFTAPDNGTRQPEIDQESLEINLCPGTPDQIQSRLGSWYRAQAITHFGERLEEMTRRLPWARDHHPTLALRRMKKTWGTCNSKAVIRLNTHLIKAPDACIDYVIVHELCHLQEMNHGRRFKALQDQWMPEWRRYRNHLCEHGHRYTQE